MAINPQHLADAYIHVAEANHYLVCVNPTYTADDLDAAEQILISRDNAADNKDAAIMLALDLLEHDRKAMFLAEDYRHIGDLIVSTIDQINEGNRMSKDLEKVASANLRAILSNNVNIILAALRIAESQGNAIKGNKDNG